MKQQKTTLRKPPEKTKNQPVQKKPGQATKTTGVASTPAWTHWLAVSLISIVTFFCFQPALNNQFLKTWDDGIYVTNNKLIDGLTAAHIAEIFSFNKDLQKFTKNYHPLTTLSLAVNHQFAGLNPRSYYLTNIFIHILNSLLVYLLIFLLTGRKVWGALFAGLLFGIHPMHVESVAWISERKDVLYGFFFIAGLIVYDRYLNNQKNGYLALVFVLFVLSVLSKAMAVVFPVTLFLFDFLRERKWSWRMVAEKLPFFAVSVFFGILALKIQANGAINDFNTYTFYQRIMHASYGVINYLVNFVFPFNLSAFYPYPFINEHHLLPAAFRIAPFVCLAVVAVTVWCLFLKSRMARVLGTGILFFLVTLVMVLQFISVGKAITADRYAYIPYIGMLFILAAGFTLLMENRRKSARMAVVAAAALLVAFSVTCAAQTRQRSAVWHDDFPLWDNVLEQFSDVRMNFIREKRAFLNFQGGNYEEALKDYRVILSLDPRDENALERVGQIQGQHFHRIDSALVYFNRACQVNDTALSLLKNMGVAYAIKADYPRSLDFLLRAYQRDPADTALMANIAATYRFLGNAEKSREFEQLIHLKK